MLDTGTARPAANLACPSVAVNIIVRIEGCVACHSGQMLPVSQLTVAKVCDWAAAVSDVPLGSGQRR